MSSKYSRVVRLVFLFLWSQLAVYGQVSDSTHVGSGALVADSLGFEEADDSTSIEDRVHPYWRKGYYDAVPYVSFIPPIRPQEFDQVFSRYQNVDFLYIEKISDKIGFWERLKRRISTVVSSLFPDYYFSNPDWVYQILGVVGALLLVYVIYRLVFTGRKVYIKHAAEDPDIGDVEFVERNLLKVDVRTYIDQALEDADYALAIRYQNLLNIQLLAGKGLIDWSHTKSTIELIGAIENEALKKDFELCSTLFNRVWFGNFPISKVEYEKYAVLFREFQMKWT